MMTTRQLQDEILRLKKEKYLHIWRMHTRAMRFWR